MSFGRRIGAVHAVAVNLPGARVRKIPVPHLVGLLGKLNALELPLAVDVKEAEFDLCRVGRE